MKKTVIYLFAIILCVGCLPIANSQSDAIHSQYIEKYDASVIDSIIQNNDYTIIFAWTEWCVGGHYHVKEDLAPFFREKPDNIGIISIFCGTAEKLNNFFIENDCEHKVYILSDSARGFDKTKFNKLLKKLFNNYKSVNYVPIVLFCDADKNILNWNASEKEYEGIQGIILGIKNKGTPKNLQTQRYAPSLKCSFT